MRPVSGFAILPLSPSLQMKLTDDYAAGNPDAHKGPVDERNALVSTVLISTVLTVPVTCRLALKKVILARYEPQETGPSGPRSE